MERRAQALERADAFGPTIHDTPERLLLREQVARFVAREVEPRGAAWERDGRVPREVIRQLGELGWLGLQVPEAYGGAAVDAVTMSPRTMPGSQRAFCASVPALTRCGDAMSVCTSTVTTNPPYVERDSASVKTKLPTASTPEPP